MDRHASATTSSRDLRAWPAARLVYGSVVAKLIYTSLASMDGYIADANGNFDWEMRYRTGR
jgi:hypothetical protein